MQYKAIRNNETGELVSYSGEYGLDYEDDTICLVKIPNDLESYILKNENSKYELVTVELTIL